MAFDSGKVIEVSPQENALFDAVKKAKSGDTLLLADGDYVESKIVPLTKTITVKARNAQQANISFERSNTF